MIAQYGQERNLRLHAPLRLFFGLHPELPGQAVLCERQRRIQRSRRMTRSCFAAAGPSPTLLERGGKGTAHLLK